ncbi:uncharacterized protein LOC144508481 isoform X3 [Mustelus asterias]
MKEPSLDSDFLDSEWTQTFFLRGLPCFYQKYTEQQISGNATIWMYPSKTLTNLTWKYITITSLSMGFCGPAAVNGDLAKYQILSPHWQRQTVVRDRRIPVIIFLSVLQEKSRGKRIILVSYRFVDPPDFNDS